jgi:hypothetical protein
MMFGMPVIEVAIGLVFVYVLLSMLCTFINEWIARLFSLRSHNLERGLKQLLADQEKTGLAREVLDHHLIKGAAANQKRQSYIASETFARVLIDIIDKKSDGAAKAAKAGNEIKRALVKAQLPEEVRSAMTGLIDNVDTTINDLRNNLQTWFDRSMERISGWYKRQLQVISFAVALLLAVSLNVDTIAVGQSLWQNPVLRAKIADEAAVAVEACRGKENPKDCSFLKETEKARERLQEFPIGWTQSAEGGPANAAWFSMKIIGWLITALAVSLGAPFWFDLLDKLNSIRSAGIKPKAMAEKTQ